MANSTAEHSSHGGGHAHITPIPKLVSTFVALLALMGTTVAWYYMFALGYIPHSTWSSWLNNLGMLAIATAKAMLVINIFMGVKHSSNLVKTYAILGFAWFTLMFIMYADYATRRWEPVKGWSPNNTLALPRSAANEADVPSRSEMEEQVEEAAKAGGGSHSGH